VYKRIITKTYCFAHVHPPNIADDRIIVARREFKRSRGGPSNALSQDARGGHARSSARRTDTGVMRAGANARARTLHMYAPCMDACSDVHTWHRTCAACTLFLPVRLTPSFHGSMARCLGFAPIYSGFSTPLRSVSRLSLLPLARPRSYPHLLPVHFSSSAFCVRPFASLRSFVRSCYSWPRASRRFGDFNAR